MKNDLTQGSILKSLLRFAVPYLVACFLQTFYGMADLFVVGLFNGAETTTAVSIGSQVIHMITVIIIGFAMGTTVRIGRNIGAGDERGAARTVGSSICLFAVIAAVMTAVLLMAVSGVTRIMMTPQEAVGETKAYLLICFAGIPLIIAYNVISSIFRGAGDSKRPLFFVLVACIVNIILDFILIGIFHMGAMGAAFGTVAGQAVSVLVAIFFMKKVSIGFQLKKSDIRFDVEEIKQVLGVGTPIACQDGMIQVSFIVITIIANSRGLIASAAVGIVEKLICFIFLVPSAFLSALSTMTAQNIGAGKAERASKALRYSLMITVFWGFLCAVYSQFLPHTLVGMFTMDGAVIVAGCQYLRSYATDTMFAAIHFCFSGYFCGKQKSIVSFIHNMISIVLIRIPGAYLTSIWFPDTLYPMGWAAPCGSLLSAFICIGYYCYCKKKEG